MTKRELKRLQKIEKEIKRIAEEEGLLTTDILFEIAPSEKVIEGMAYRFPVNFSHWSFGRDYDKIRTIYEYTGGGIPYEQVWNFDAPKAFLSESNPFSLQVTTIAHVYGHVDFFLANRYCQHSRLFSDVAAQARNAAGRFRGYEENYGKAVEQVIDAGFSIEWHQHTDPTFIEPEEEKLRQYLIEKTNAKLLRLRDPDRMCKNSDQKEIEALKIELQELAVRTPPAPTYDILNYIIKHSPSPLKPWTKDVLTVIKNQARALAPLGRTKLLNEGWATYWHTRIMRRLLKEGIITAEEHGVFNNFNAKITSENRSSFNWYRIGLALFENVKERWDKGRFGREYEECGSYSDKINWDTSANLGTKKIFEIRSSYSDRMAIEDLFTNDFIRGQKLYIYQRVTDLSGNPSHDIIEDDPEIIRSILTKQFTFRSPVIAVEDGNYDSYQHLYLKHHDTGYELDPAFRNKTLEKIYYIWGRKVVLETKVDGAMVKVNYNGHKHQMVLYMSK